MENKLITLTVSDREFTNIEDLLAGFIVKGDKELTFNMIASPTLSFNTGMQLLQSMTVNLLTAFIRNTPEAVEDIYDAYNFMASSVLNNLIPEKELRQDLDEQAILDAYEKHLDEKIEKMSKKDKAAARAKIAEIKGRLKEKSDNAKDTKTV